MVSKRKHDPTNMELTEQGEQLALSKGLLTKKVK